MSNADKKSKSRKYPRVECELKGNIVFDVFDEQNVPTKILQLSEAGAILIPEHPLGIHRVFILQIQFPEGDARLVCRTLRQDAGECSSTIAVAFDDPQDVPHTLSKYIKSALYKDG